MRKRLLLLGVYFIITPIFIFTLIFYQFFLFNQVSSNSSKVFGVGTKGVDYTALPNINETNSYFFISHEARVDTLTEFFERYDSPLANYSENIIVSADKYGLDWRLLPAIAMQESTLCLKAPEGLNNCWGFGIYGTKKLGFESYAEGIEVVSQAIAEDYHGIGLIDAYEIMSKYTPSNDGEWAENVTYVMERISSSL